MILAIDPGTYASAYVVWDEKKEEIREMGIIFNNSIIEFFLIDRKNAEEHCVIEFIQCQGKVVGDETFHTAKWVGRFEQAWGDETVLMYRREVLVHLLGTTRTGGKSSDSLITQALVKRFGYKSLAEAKRGKLKGVKFHIWSALAVAVTYGDKLKDK